MIQQAFVMLMAQQKRCDIGRASDPAFKSSEWSKSYVKVSFIAP